MGITQEVYRKCRGTESRQVGIRTGVLPTGGSRLQEGIQRVARQDPRRMFLASCVTTTIGGGMLRQFSLKTLSGRSPNLVQPKIAGLPVRIKRIQYIEIAGIRKPG